MRRWLLFLLLVMLFGAWLGHQILRDPGYILIAYEDLTVETSLWIGLLVMVVGVVLLYVAVRLLTGVRVPARNLRQWRARRRDRVAQESTTKGLIELAEGRWKQSQRHLLKSAEHSGTPLINYLAAARAAHEQGREKESHNLLQQAQESTPGAAVAVGLAQAQMQLEDGQWEQAQATLMRLREQAPRHAQILKLLKWASVELEDWRQLHKLLPELTQHRLIQPAEAAQLETRIYTGLVRDIAQSEGDRKERLSQLNEVWEQMPASLHHNEALVLQYVHLLQELNSSERAEAALRRSLENRWSSRLVQEYGLLSGGDAKRQLKEAENWLQSHPNDADLLLALGRICMRNQLWGKACDYMEKSLQLRKNAEACAELARLYDHLGDRKKSQRFFTESLQLLNRDLPQLPMPSKVARG